MDIKRIPPFIDGGIPNTCDCVMCGTSHPATPSYMVPSELPELDPDELCGACLSKYYPRAADKFRAMGVVC